MDTKTANCKQKYEGKEYFTSDGKEKFVITQFNSGSDVNILFHDVPGGLEMRKSVYQLNQGIPNPFPNNSPVYFSDPYKKYINTCYRTNEGFIVDKDLLYRFYANETSGIKCYGPRYCVVIPLDLNAKLQLTNVKK